MDKSVAAPFMEHFLRKHKLRKSNINYNMKKCPIIGTYLQI